MALSLVARKARLQAIGSLINANSGGAVHLYAAPAMDTPEDVPLNAPLAIVALAANCGLVGDASGLATFTFTPVVGNAAATGLVAWARFVDGAGVAVYDALAGVPGGGFPVVVTDNKTVPSAQVYAGGEVQIVSAVLVE